MESFWIESQEDKADSSVLGKIQILSKTYWQCHANQYPEQGKGPEFKMQADQGGGCSQRGISEQVEDKVKPVRMCIAKERAEKSLPQLWWLL